METNIKKRILITIYSMNIGGAERSLIGLLNTIDYRKFDVYLKIYQHNGEFMRYIPRQVNVLPYEPKYDVFEVPIKSLLFSKRFAFGIARVFSKIELFIRCKLKRKKSGVWNRLQYTHKYVLPILPRIKGKYDLALSFIGIHNIVIKKVEANVKVGWIHTDYNQLTPDRKLDQKVYSKLDYIVNVSEECQQVFLKHYPEFSEKAVVLENILSPTVVRQQSVEKEVSSEILIGREIRLLSIGRFGYAKNFDNIPEICSILINKGVLVKWYIIGYGNDENLIRKKIKETGMQSNVIILGKKDNPYPYIKACDIYVQPSRYEGKAVTVRESQILCKPTVVTNYETAGSQIQDGINGIIVPMDNQGCAEGIYELIINEQLQLGLINNCEKMEFGNESEINKIYNMCL